MIQEHWLFTENLASLNINDDFTSFAVSGMWIVHGAIIRGHPFGGCGFLIPNLLLPFINRILILKDSVHITITTNCWTVLLYMPTNYGTAHSHDTYLETLGELKGINNYVTSISFLFTFFVLHV